MNTNTQNWKAALKAQPDLQTFLLMVLKDNHLLRLPVKLSLRPTGGRGSHRGITISYHGNALMYREYARVDRYMYRRGMDYRKFYEWQWIILHEVTHAICGKRGKLNWQGKKARATPLDRMVKNWKRNPHGTTFCRILLRLARKYEAHAPVQSNNLENMDARASTSAE